MMAEPGSETLQTEVELLKQIIAEKEAEISALSAENLNMKQSISALHSLFNENKAAKVVSVEEEEELKKKEERKLKKKERRELEKQAEKEKEIEERKKRIHICATKKEGKCGQCPFMLAGDYRCKSLTDKVSKTAASQSYSGHLKVEKLVDSVLQTFIELPFAEIGTTTFDKLERRKNVLNTVAQKLDATPIATMAIVPVHTADPSSPPSSRGAL